MRQMKDRSCALVLVLLGRVCVVVLNHELDLTGENEFIDPLKMMNQRPMHDDGRQLCQKTGESRKVGVAF